MLRIKENIPLKKLKEYGFKEKDWGYIYLPKKEKYSCKYFSTIRIYHDEAYADNVIEFHLENIGSWCNSLEELDEDFEKIKYSIGRFKELINKLIQDGLVEEV